MSLVIRHTHAGGTVLEGTSRGDGSAEVLKKVINPYTGRAGAWRWSRNLGNWYVPRSRDTRAYMALIEATEKALTAAGFEVAHEIDDNYRAAADVEADAVARQADRAAALDEKAQRAGSASDAADVRARELAARMPLGQPIIIGHHSERRMRKAYNDIEKASRASVQAYREAQAAQAKAAAAAATTGCRYNPAVIRRRIERLEAELRRWQRTRDGYTRTVYTDPSGTKHVQTQSAASGAYQERALAEIGRLEDQICYWKAELANAAAAGAQVWDAATIEVGDQIRYWGGWATVAKVNAKSLRLSGRRGRLPFDQVKAVKTSDGRAVSIVTGERTIADQSATSE